MPFQFHCPSENAPSMDRVSSKGPEVQAIFSAIARRYDLANHLLSAGLDFSWRRVAAEIVRNWKVGRVLDMATGSGDLAQTIRARCPRALVVGADFCQPMLATAARKGLPLLVAADALCLPFEDGVFDAVTVAFGLRNMESWPGALCEMGRVIRPGGHILVLDFSVPRPPLRWIYRPYLHFVLPWLAAILTGEKAAYEYLGDSIEKFPQGASMCQLIENAGFSDAQCRPLSGGIVSLYTAERSPRAPCAIGDDAGKGVEMAKSDSHDLRSA
jgi:demethylmenaquinone methyltransferase / 2-methoxy-6-polyprenyl-1,4-benzoquinol methylase